jgi:hypothetical protein
VRGVHEVWMAQKREGSRSAAARVKWKSSLNYFPNFSKNLQIVSIPR